MKQGKTLKGLAAELQRQLESKKDYIADTRKISMTDTGMLAIETLGEFGVNSHAHQQIASRVDIPKKYYDKMLNFAPHLLSSNVNHWLQKNPEERMIRTLDGRVRAFLSKRYRPLDNYDLASVVLPQIDKQGCEVVSCDVTETRMYIKVISTKVVAEVTVGDVVQSGIVISNSEVGSGSLRIEPLVYRLVCNNGMISKDSSLRKYHVGGRNTGEGDNVYEFLKDETKQQDDKAFWMKVRDIVAASFDQIQFDKTVTRMQHAASQQITGNVSEVVEVTSSRLMLSDDEQNGVLKHLVNGGDLSKYGLLNAVTRMSQDIDDYGRATDFEYYGSSVLDITDREWTQMNVQ